VNGEVGVDAVARYEIGRQQHIPRQFALNADAELDRVRQLRVRIDQHTVGGSGLEEVQTFDALAAQRVELRLERRNLLIEDRYEVGRSQFGRYSLDRLVSEQSGRSRRRVDQRQCGNDVDQLRQ